MMYEALVATSAGAETMLVKAYEVLQMVALLTRALHDLC